MQVEFHSLHDMFMLGYVAWTYGAWRMGSIGHERLVAACEMASRHFAEVADGLRASYEAYRGLTGSDPLHWTRDLPREATISRIGSGAMWIDPYDCFSEAFVLIAYPLRGQAPLAVDRGELLNNMVPQIRRVLRVDRRNIRQLRRSGVSFPKLRDIRDVIEAL
jgi:hypothetical protein